MLLSFLLTVVDMMRLIPALGSSEPGFVDGMIYNQFVDKE